MVDFIKDWLFTKWVAKWLARLVVLAVLFFLPAILLWVFNVNLLGLQYIMQMAYGLLPQNLSVPAQVIGQGGQLMYAGASTTVQGLVAWFLPWLDPLQVQGAVRAILGEGWLLILEISYFLRFAWFIIRPKLR